MIKSDGKAAVQATATKTTICGVAVSTKKPVPPPRSHRQKAIRSTAGWDELEATRRAKGDNCHLVKRHMIGDARAPTSAEWKVGRSGRDRDASS